MTRSTLIVILFGLLVLAYLGYKAKTHRPARESASEAEVGALIFGEDCAYCHAPDGGTGSLTAYDGTRAEFLAMIDFGPAPMPSFEGQYTEQERAALWTYVSSLAS